MSDTLDPELAKKLLGLPEGKDLVAFLAGSAMQLNLVADIPETLTTPEEIALEVLARRRAYGIIIHILDALLSGSGGSSIKTDPAEYAA